jgi:hypothetical protein
MIAQAVVSTMAAPDAAPLLPALEQMLKMSIGLTHRASSGGGQSPGPGAGGPGQGIGAMLAGQPPGQPPGPGGPGGPSMSGASAEDIRQMIGANA